MSSQAISTVLSLHLKPTFPSPSAQNTSWQGRLCSFATEKIKLVSQYIHAIAYAILYPLNLVLANTWESSSVFRKLTQNVLPMIEHLKGLPDHFAKLKTVLGSSFNIIDAIRIFDTANCLINGKYKNLSAIEFSAKAFLSAGYAMEGTSWLSSIGLLPSLSIGSTRIFGRAINGTLGIAHAFSVVETILKIPVATNDAAKKLLMFQLAKHLGELTLSLMMLAGRMSPISLGAMGVACIGLEILNMMHKERYENTKL